MSVFSIRSILSTVLIIGTALGATTWAAGDEPSPFEARSATSTTYADAASGALDGWRVYDVSPAGATIENVVDDSAGVGGGSGRAYEFTGTGTNNAFLLGGFRAGEAGWNNGDAQRLAWRMRLEGAVTVYALVGTRDGLRYLAYESRARAPRTNGAGTVLYFGLGDEARDGQWHTWSRDVREDLAALQPDNELNAVHGFLVRESGRFDDIEMTDASSNGADDAGGSAGEETDTGASDGGTGGQTDGATTGATGGDTGEQTDGSTTAASDGTTGGEGSGSTDGSTSGSTDGDGSYAVSAEEAARLLAQASFGATMDDIARVRSLGIEGWIDDQLRLRGPAHLPYVRENYLLMPPRKPRHDIWWRNAIDGQDQLRQRVAFALSQIFVVSDIGYTLGNAQRGMAAYYDVLRNGAFGNYRDLLESITLQPVMGVFLSMLQNDKGDADGNTRADENFAREVLQLFSIGPHMLGSDGLTTTRGNVPVPSYSQLDVENYARVFTGWNFANTTNWNFNVISTDADRVSPMVPDEAHHDTDAKTLLGGVRLPAGNSARRDLDAALDSIARHPNVGPFISGRLIRFLVTSNPTPGYVRRVADVFNNDGTGQRGNLGAVVKAILMDREARSGHTSIRDFGKLREPVLRITHLWRAFNVSPGSQSINGNYNTQSPTAENLNLLIGQAVLRAPSVFNFFRPDYAPLGDIRNAGLVAPEAELFTDGNILATTTRMNQLIQRYHDLTDANSRIQSLIDLSTERAVLAQGPDALLDRLDLLLLSGGMSDGLRALLRNHIVTFPETEAGRSSAVRDTISLIVASPEYLVQL